MHLNLSCSYLTAGRFAIPGSGSVSELDRTEVNITVLPNSIYSVLLRVNNEEGSGDYGPVYRFSSSNVPPKPVSITGVVSMVLFQHLKYNRLMTIFLYAEC